MSPRTIFLAVMALIFICPIAGADPSAENGKTIYGIKCVVCHSIGSGKIVGPDLKGVTTRREKSWLLGYIKDPDKYLQTDPIAQALLKEHVIPMPNPALSETEVADVVAYLETQV
jgi:nitrite reductase (NO-forming)